MLKKLPAKLDGVRAVRDIVRPRSWCLYGRSGTGKTTLAATFPSPILLLDVRDRGTDSVADHQKLDVKDIDSMEDLEDTFYFLKENPKAYKTVAIDTATQLQQLCIEEVVKAGRKGLAPGDWGSMGRRQWGDVSAKMKEWVLNYRNLTDLGMELIFIAQERTSSNSDDDDTSDNLLIPEVGPAVMPSIATHLNANVSVIGNTFIRVKRTKIKRGTKTTEKEDAQYCLRIGPNPVYTTKFRKPRGITAPAFIEDPTYKDILEVMQEGE